MNVSANIIKQVDNLIISGEVTGKPFGGSDFTRILKGVINTCDISKGMFGNFIVQMVKQSFEKYSNWQFECPQKGGFFYATNFAVSDEYLPVYLLVKPGYFYANLYTKAKIGKGKPALNIMTIKLLGSYTAN